MRRVIGVLAMLAGCAGGVGESSTSGNGASELRASDAGSNAPAPPVPCYGEEVMVRQCLDASSDPRLCQPFLEALFQCQAGTTNPPTPPRTDAGAPTPPVACYGEEVAARDCLAATNDPIRCQPLLDAAAQCHGAGNPTPPNQCLAEEMAARQCLTQTNDPARCQVLFDAVDQCHGASSADGGTPPAPPTQCLAEETAARQCLAQTNDPARCQPLFDAVARCHGNPSSPDAGVPPSPPNQCLAEETAARQCLTQTNDPMRCQPLLDAVAQCHGQPSPPNPPPGVDGGAPVECDWENEQVRQCLVQTNDPRQCEPYFDALAQCQTNSRP